MYGREILSAQLQILLSTTLSLQARSTVSDDWQSAVVQALGDGLRLKMTHGVISQTTPYPLPPSDAVP